MKKRSNNLLANIMITVAAVLLVSNSVLGIISVSTARVVIRDSIRQRMLDIANCAAGSIDGDALEALTKDSKGSEEYSKIYNTLAIFRDNVELEYVYSIKDEGGGRFTFIIDTDPDAPGKFGEEVKSTAALRRAATGSADVDVVSYSDAWGEFYSAYSPVFDSEGKVAGIIAVDFSAEWFDFQLSEQMRSNLTGNIIVLVLMLLLAETLCFIIIRPFVKRQQQLSDEVEQKAEENKQMFMEVVHSLADAIDAKDPYTNGHSGRVAAYSQEIARRYGYTGEALENIYMSALLHDVGKIGVPDRVINKPSTLSNEEYSLIKRHTVMGDRILGNIATMPKLRCSARWHHERYGGGGYPDNLSGDDIPEEERIISVADAYDAMTSDRSYRKAMPQDKVRDEIVKGKGTQFDPVFADIMLKMIDEDKDFRLREHPDLEDKQQ